MPRQHIPSELDVRCVVATSTAVNNRCARIQHRPVAIRTHSAYDGWQARQRQRLSQCRECLPSYVPSTLHLPSDRGSPPSDASIRNRFNITRVTTYRAPSKLQRHIPSANSRSVTTTRYSSIDLSP